MSTPEQKPVVCERCDRESLHYIKQTEPDNSVHYVCWDCLRREEKRVNVSRTWKRSRRANL
ncbi:MAG: hypothetical protein ACRD9R_02870 [Pyrinomonadaceae bacterium]